MTCAFHRIRSLGRLLSCIASNNGQNMLNTSIAAASLEVSKVRPFTLVLGSICQLFALHALLYWAIDQV